MTDKERIEEMARAREHFNYGISHDIFKEPVLLMLKLRLKDLTLWKT
jgi:hypothetical protein